MGLFDHFPYTNFHELNLDWMLTLVKELYEEVAKHDNWISTHEKEYLELKKLYDDIVSGNFPPEMYSTLHNWVALNAKSIMADIIKMAFFGLENGYLVVYIPDSWSELLFGTTGLDDFPTGYDFGHLTITY